MRVLVTGGRDYQDVKAVRAALSEIGATVVLPTLVHGAAKGADYLARCVAYYELGWPEEAHPAEWEKWGKSAGFRRNQEMVDSGADLCLAFPGGRGTMHCVRCAEEAGIPVRHVA